MPSGNAKLGKKLGKKKRETAKRRNVGRRLAGDDLGHMATAQAKVEGATCYGAKAEGGGNHQAGSDAMGPCAMPSIGMDGL